MSCDVICVRVCVLRLCVCGVCVCVACRVLCLFKEKRIAYYWVLYAGEWEWCLFPMNSGLYWLALMMVPSEWVSGVCVCVSSRALPISVVNVVGVHDRSSHYHTQDPPQAIGLDLVTIVMVVLVTYARWWWSVAMVICMMCGGEQWCRCGDDSRLDDGVVMEVMGWWEW